MKTSENFSPQPKLCSSYAIALVVAASLLTSCSSSKTPETGALQAHRISLRQVPPQPVYSRVRFGLDPSPLPSRELPRSNADLINPIVHMELKNATLEEASSVLAAVSRYTSYTASTIAKQRISLNMLGTVDEIASHIAAEAGIKVVVDHDVRQVRFLTGIVTDESGDMFTEASPEEPRFLGEAQ